MDIDLVYTYVNSSDEEWLAERNQFAMDHNNQACRFRDNNELKYSLRSVERYAPWIRTVHIVLDGRVPDWLDTSNSKLHILKSCEILPEEALPCYNSNVIESCIDQIPGLSDIFLYACDDMFLGSHVKKDFFVSDGKPLIRMRKKQIIPQDERYYSKVLYNSQQMIAKRFGVQYNLIPLHCIDVFSKDGIRKCREEFAEEFRAALKNHIRMDTDIQKVIFHYFMIAKDMCVLKPYEDKAFFDKLKELIFPNKYLDFKYYNLDHFFNSKGGLISFFRNPKLVCINDSEKTTERDLRLYRILMEIKFPCKSSFER